MRRSLAVGCALLVAGPVVGQGESRQPAAPLQVVSPFRPFDRDGFTMAVKALGASDEQLQWFAGEAAEVGLARAADDLLRRVVPAFDAAVAAAEQGDPAAALALTRLLAGPAQPLLRGHVRYHLARLFLDSDDPERAIEVWNDYLREDINQSPLDAEAAYFYAQALAELPMVDEAIPRFRAFLRWFPAASERFRSAAHQRLLELEQQRESQLHQLADGMKKTARDLRKRRTDKPVQLDQQRYLEQLDELIEMFEEMERQSSGPAAGLGPPSAPADSGALPEGESTVGTLNRRPSLADRWGDMKDKEREQIMADVQNTMPPQYQKMLEDYYKKLGKAGGRR